MVIVYKPFNVLLSSVCWYFAEDFFISSHNDKIVFSSYVFVWLWYRIILAFQNWEVFVPFIYFFIIQNFY